MKNVIDSIMYSLSLSIISGVFVVLMMLISTIYFGEGIFLQMTLPTILSIFLIPYLINRCQKTRYECTISSIDIITISVSVVLSVLIILILYNQFELELLCFHYFIVAISEEYLYRGIIYHRLSTELETKLLVVIISSCIFAFVGHMGEPFYNNLLYRFPLGLLLAVLREKSHGITQPIVAHALYNTIITIW